MFIRCYPEGLHPTNEHFLQDVHPETCSWFESGNTSKGQQYTQFRMEAFDADVGDINISITGSNLGCGHNLYVSSLSPDMSETWLGRWTSCQLVNISVNANRETCSFWCKSPGHAAEIQFLKFARSSEESHWEVCQINITASYPGE